MKDLAVLGSKANEGSASREGMLLEDRRAAVHMLRSSHRESGGSDLRKTQQESGRKQKRLTLAVPLWLTSLDQPGELDWAVTGNVSEHGARILTKRRWRVGESVLVSLPPNFSAYGRVVYCQSLPSGNYVMGIQIGEASAAWLESLEGAA